jgi:hypothetical protein
MKPDTVPGFYEDILHPEIVLTLFGLEGELSEDSGLGEGGEEEAQDHAPDRDVRDARTRATGRADHRTLRLSSGRDAFRWIWILGELG